jgi:hypothetical protein
MAVICRKQSLILKILVSRDFDSFSGKVDRFDFGISIVSTSPRDLRTVVNLALSTMTAT